MYPLCGIVLFVTGNGLITDTDRTQLKFTTTLLTHVTGEGESQ